MVRHLVLLLICALFCTSCVDMVIKIDIKDNWSGTMAVNVEMLDQMYQMALMQAQQSGQDMTFLNEDSLRSMAEDHGGKLRKFKSEVENGVRKIDMEIWLEDAAKLAEVNDKDMFSLTQEEGGNWRLGFLDNAMADAFKDMDQATWEQQMAMLAPMMTGLKWRMDISVPELVGTNLKQKDSTASFEMDFDKDIAGKEPQAAVETFKQLILPKWVTFKGAAK